MDTKDYVTLVLGAVGATLGVVNFIQKLADERVRLRVTPKLSFRAGGGVFNDKHASRLVHLLETYGPPTISVEVINLSKFPIVVDEVGLCESDTSKERAPFLQPILTDGQKWPLRLEPRASATVLSSGDHALSYPFTSRTRGYAATACDTIKTGDSGALRKWMETSKQFRTNQMDRSFGESR